MKPTVQGPDFYTIGNDFAQAPISAYFDVSATWTKKDLCDLAGVEESDYSAISGNVDALIGQPKYYQDGIYTKLADELSGFSDPRGFNRRTILVNPSAKYTDDDYSKGDVIYDGVDDPSATSASV